MNQPVLVTSPCEENIETMQEVITQFFEDNHAVSSTQNCP